MHFNDLSDTLAKIREDCSLLVSFARGYVMTRITDDTVFQNRQMGRVTNDMTLNEETSFVAAVLYNE